MRRRIGLGLGIGMAVMAMNSPGAQGATIVVDVLDDTPFAVNFDCALRKAVQSANTNTDVAGCESTGGYGTAEDTIVLAFAQGGSTFADPVEMEFAVTEQQMGGLDVWSRKAHDPQCANCSPTSWILY